MDLTFTPPGPVAAAFLADRSFVSAIMGPMGSAKTSTTIMKFVNMAFEQPPSPLDGIRYTKVGVVRETTTNLKRTTVKSITNWFKGKGKLHGGGSSLEPLSFKVGFALPDGTKASLTFEFIGLDGNNIEDMAKGWEITHYWLNEGDLLAPDIKNYLDGRIGRYPGKLDGGCPFYCGIIDFNAPDTENYLYDLFEVARPGGHTLFRQPGGRSAQAENIHNLPAGYYDRMAQGKESWWVRRNIDAVYGFSRDGDPVYESYNDDVHCGSKLIEPVPGLPIKMYADAALHPAMVWVQTMPDGQRRILEEVYVKGGAVQLAAKARKKMADKRYQGFRFIGGYVDPSAGKRNENDSDGDSWIDTLNAALNLTGSDMFRPAPTNDPAKRQDAVKHHLNSMVGAGVPMLLVSARAVEARKGFNSTYRFKKRSNGDSEEKPEKKHPVSDIHDSIQYACLDDGGYEEVAARAERRTKAWAKGKTYTARIEMRA